MRLLLLSNSRNPGQGYLEHVRRELTDFLGGIQELLFVPYAGVQISHDQYAGNVRKAFSELGVRIASISDQADPVAAVQAAKAIAVGGGNSFRLLQLMYQHAVLDAVRDRVMSGIPYLGWSAGSNLACPTIRTTNDMPIVEPPSLSGLNLVPFQINPHFTDATIPNHGGETRSERIAEFVTLNPRVTVAGLREGSWFRREGDDLRLGGPHSVRLFKSGNEPRESGPQEDFQFLLRST